MFEGLNSLLAPSLLLHFRYFTSFLHFGSLRFFGFFRFGSSRRFFRFGLRSKKPSASLRFAKQKAFRFASVCEAKSLPLRFGLRSKKPSASSLREGAKEAERKATFAAASFASAAREGKKFLILILILIF
uniref:Transmembrane protein n=1 Tax=Pediastrum duplex TaxID=3105 RepID=A0A1W5RMM8_PEDDU|nr:hypothetical protein [Pediastrum duplex]YP_009364110.1 hypothetical protein [Pediastrum duplex]AQU64457.1 hypothetical protein [Pediastrum duplex]AQU64458.1 hypothetical protein [Pediastrum duplex]